MQDRLNQNDVTNRVNVEDPARVRDAVLALYGARYPGIDPAPLVRAFADFQALFEGNYPGYLACDTLYHDMRHTLDMTLAMARLVDGHDRACATRDRLGPRRALLGVLIALLHDCGYLRRSAETGVENGAVFTRTHVSRGAEFIAAYLPRPRSPSAWCISPATRWRSIRSRSAMHATACSAAWWVPPT